MTSSLRTNIVLTEQLLGAFNEIDRLQQHGQKVEPQELTDKLTHENADLKHRFYDANMQIQELQKQLDFQKQRTIEQENRAEKLIELCEQNGVVVPEALKLPF